MYGMLQACLVPGCFLVEVSLKGPAVASGHLLGWGGDVGDVG